MPIDKSMFEYHRDAFPTDELAAYDYGPPLAMRSAMRIAGTLLDEFERTNAEIVGNPKLSAVGKSEARQSFVSERLPIVTETLEKVRKEVVDTEQHLTRKMTEKLVGGSDEHGVEIRAWLCSMANDTDRSDAIRKLVGKGDYSALKAVLTAPSYLAGVDQETLGYLRDDALKQIEPERFGMLDAVRRGHDAAQKAVSAAIRAVEQVVNAPILEPSRPPVPNPPQAKPLDPETQRRINEATEAALARQEAANRPQAA